MTGEYAGYIAASYGVAALVLAGVAAQSIISWRRIRADVEKLDAGKAGDSDA